MQVSGLPRHATRAPPMDSRFRGNDGGGAYPPRADGPFPSGRGACDDGPGGRRSRRIRPRTRPFPPWIPAFAGTGSARSGISRAWSAEPTPTRTSRDFFTRSFAGMTGGGAYPPRADGLPGASVPGSPPRHSRESGNPYSYLDSCFRGDEGPVTSARGTPKDPSFPAMDSRFRGNDERGGRDGLPRHSPAFAGTGSARSGISRAWSAEPTPTRTCRDFFTRSFAGMTEGGRIRLEPMAFPGPVSRPPPPPRHSRESGNPYSYLDSCFPSGHGLDLRRSGCEYPARMSGGRRGRARTPPGAPCRRGGGVARIEAT